MPDITLTEGEAYVFAKIDDKAVILSGTDNAQAKTQFNNDVEISGSSLVVKAPTNAITIDSDNTSNTPQILIYQKGNADSGLRFRRGAESFTIGIDYSDSDTFKIGNGSTVASNAVISITTGEKVGIGVEDPTEKLEVVGDMSCSVDLHVGDDIFVGGNVGIGDTSPNAKLHVKTDTGNSSDYVAYFQNTRTHRSQSVVRISTSAAGGGGTIDIDDNATFIDFWGNNNSQIMGAISTGANGWGTAYGSNSDRRLKENIIPTAFGLKDLLKLEVCDYNWKADTSSSALATGLIAQDVGKIYPAAAIIPSEESGRYASIDYGRFTPLLIQAIQDQQKVIDDLQKRITKMENI